MPLDGKLTDVQLAPLDVGLPQALTLPDVYSLNPEGQFSVASDMFRYASLVHPPPEPHNSPILQ